jgi:hypothetical protein
MCHLVRQQNPATAAQGDAALPPATDGLPRWVGAGAAALIGGLALAAIFTPPAMVPPLHARESTAPAAVTTVHVPVPVEGPAAALAGRAGAMPADDGVPAAPEVAKAGLGHCHHGL